MLLTIGELLTAQARLRRDEPAARDLELAMGFSVGNDRAYRLANGFLSLGLV